MNQNHMNQNRPPFRGAAANSAYCCNYASTCLRINSVHILDRLVGVRLQIVRVAERPVVQLLHALVRHPVQLPPSGLSEREPNQARAAPGPAADGVQAQAHAAF